MSEPSQNYRFGPFELRSAELLLLKDGQPIHLNQKSAATLLALLEFHGNVRSKDELLKRVWSDSFVEEGVLSRNICDIRKAIGNGYIQTLPKRGYRFAAPVTHHGHESDRRPLSLAILPFRLISGESTHGYLGLALADAIIGRMARLARIVVRPSSSVFKVASAESDAISVGRALCVDSVLEGTLQVLRDRVRLRLQLARVADGNSSWSATFDQRFSDLFELEDRVAIEVASALALRLSGLERKIIGAPSTRNAKAYQLFLKGRQLLLHPNSQDFTAPLKCFEKALQLDPAFAECYASMAIFYSIITIHLCGDPTQLVPRSKAAALKALEFSHNQQEARTALAFALWHYDFEWRSAEIELLRLLDDNPNDVATRHHYSMLLMETGRFDKARSQIREAISLDPSSSILCSSHGLIELMARDYQQAHDLAMRALTMDKNNLRALLVAGLALEQMGFAAKAVSRLRKAAEQSANASTYSAALAHAYLKAGRSADAKKVLRSLETRAAGSYVSSSDLAVPFIALGEYDRAFYFLFRAVREHSTSLALAAVDPRLDPLRSDPRFRDILNQIHLSPFFGKAERAKV